MTAITPQANSRQPPALAGRFLVRCVLMALIWLGLNGADWSSWIVGGPVVIAAAWISVKLLPDIPWHWTVGWGIAFAGFFLRESLRGGWDVATRALSPTLSLSPAIVTYPLHLPTGPARLFFCSVISLLPGTAVVAIGKENLSIHVLDLSPGFEKEMRDLERRVASLFGLALSEQTKVSS